MAFARLALLALAAAACQAATVIGLVVDATTLQPVRKTEVSLATTGAKPEFALAVTGADGQFRFDGLPAGGYRLGAARDRYLPAPSVRLQLAASEVRAGIVLKLRRSASISGQVVDAEGDPVAMAMVQLLHAGYRRGKLVWVPVTGARADMHGRYLLDRVPPLTYRVMATAGFDGQQPTSPVISAQQPAVRYGYGSQFFPGSDDLDGAAPIVVRPGEEITGIDFHLPFRPRATLVFTFAGLPEGSGRDTEVRINAKRRDGFTGQGWGIAWRPGQPAPRLINMDPGPYMVSTSAAVAGQTYCALQSVEVAGGETPVAVALQPGFDLAGSVRIEGGEAGPLHVILVAGENNGLWPQPSTVVKPDGQFVLRGVPPGLWDIDVGPVPAGGYIKSMLLGDQDVLTEDMVIGPESKGPLRIVLSARGARLEGEVQDLPPDAPPPVIVAAPQGRDARVLGFFGSARADENGRFEIKGLRPGDYRVYALDEMDGAQWENPDYLVPYAARAEAVQLREGATAIVKPHLISLAAGGADQ